MCRSFLLDTSSINEIIKEDNLLQGLVLLKEKNAEFFIVPIQENELHGLGANVYNENGLPEYLKWMPDEAFLSKVKLIKDKLDIKEVQEFATLMPNHWVLNGKERMIDQKCVCMVNEILSLYPTKREKRKFSQYYDAQIAEAAMSNNFVLVSNDTDLIKIVNSYYPGKAITIDDFKNRFLEISI